MHFLVSHKNVDGQYTGGVVTRITSIKQVASIKARNAFERYLESAERLGAKQMVVTLVVIKGKAYRRSLYMLKDVCPTFGKNRTKGDQLIKKIVLKP